MYNTTPHCHMGNSSMQIACVNSAVCVTLSGVSSLSSVSLSPSMTVITCSLDLFLHGFFLSPGKIKKKRTMSCKRGGGGKRMSHTEKCISFIFTHRGRLFPTFCRGFSRRPWDPWCEFWELKLEQNPEHCQCFLFDLMLEPVRDLTRCLFW